LSRTFYPLSVFEFLRFVFFPDFIPSAGSRFFLCLFPCSRRPRERFLTSLLSFWIVFVSEHFSDFSPQAEISAVWHFETAINLYHLVDTGWVVIYFWCIGTCASHVIRTMGYYNIITKSSRYIKMWNRRKCDFNIFRYIEGDNPFVEYDYAYFICIIINIIIICRLGGYLTGYYLRKPDLNYFLTGIFRILYEHEIKKINAFRPKTNNFIILLEPTYYVSPRTL